MPAPLAVVHPGELDDTGLDWQQSLGDWWQSEKPWLREQTHLESAKQRDWFFWRQKRGVVIAGRMSAAEGKLVAEWRKVKAAGHAAEVLAKVKELSK